MDFIAYMERFPKAGETIIGQGFATSPGGKGANQAVAIARLGVRTHFISKVGTDFVGDMLLDNLRKERVSVEDVRRDPRANSGVAVIYVSSSGENMIAVAPGVDHLIEPRDIEAAERTLESSKVVLAQLEIPVQTVEFAMSLAKRKGKLTLLNPAPAIPLRPEVLESVDVLTPNRVELEALTRRTTATDESILESALTLMKKGIKQVVVTLGSRGAMVVTESEHRIVPSYRIEVVDTVGAGDAFNGALAVALSVDKGVFEAVRFANLVAALKVTKRGAQTGLPTLKQVVEFSEAKGLGGVPRSLLSLI
jgi:ribokinase